MHPLTPRWRRATRSAAVIGLIGLGTASEAQAYELLFRVASISVGYSLEASSQSSGPSSSRSKRAEKNRAEKNRAAKNRAAKNRSAGKGAPPGPDGTLCTSDDECPGRCLNGECVDDAPALVVKRSVAPSDTTPFCEDDQSCNLGWACHERHCVEAPPLEARPVEKCVRDGQCLGGQRCSGGQCLSVPPAPPAFSKPRRMDRPRVQTGGCADNQACAVGHECRDSRCVLETPSGCTESLGCRTEVPPLPPRSIPQCSASVACGEGTSCVGGQCATTPPLPPSTLLLRRGTELYLRGQAVQLRQDLALGEGPVISRLAWAQQVSPVVLGQALRTHRAQVVALMGDGTDPGWTNRLLLWLEALPVESS